MACRAARWPRRMGSAPQALAHNGAGARLIYRGHPPNLSDLHLDSAPETTAGGTDDPTTILLYRT